VHVVPLGQSDCCEHIWISPAAHVPVVGVPEPLASQMTVFPEIAFGYVQPGAVISIVAPWRQHATAPVMPAFVQSATCWQVIGIAVPAPPFVQLAVEAAHICGSNPPASSGPPRQQTPSPEAWSHEKDGPPSSGYPQ
jgi:hypothetical protein